MAMDRLNTIKGSLVADAASMGLHWLYDQQQIKLIEQTGDILFRQPDASHYKDRRGYFAHGTRCAGELSHYGESARVMAQFVKQQQYDTAAYQSAFQATFGPCGTYQGYADRPTKVLVAKIINDGEELSARSGMDDNQMPAFCVISGLFAAGYDIASIEEAAAVISINADVTDGIRVVTHCLELLLEGVELSEALVQSAAKAEGQLSKLLNEALQIETYQPLETASHFGLACYVEHSLPVVWHLLNHATDFESVVRDNVRCGGDCCGRSMALGTIAGLVFDVPDEMVRRMKNGHIPLY